MPKPVFRRERCKGCALCADACPQKLLDLGSDINSKGYHPARCLREEACTGCSLCARACPDVVIEVWK